MDEDSNGCDVSSAFIVNILLLYAPIKSVYLRLHHTHCWPKIKQDTGQVLDFEEMWK